MDVILSALDSVLSSLLPADIFGRLDLYYNGAILCLGAGLVLMLAAVALMIAAVRRGKKQAVEA